MIQTKEDIDVEILSGILFGTSFTFGFLKPETERLGSRNAIISDINSLGFPVIASDNISLQPQTIESIYEEWWGEPKRDRRLVEYLTSEKILAFIARDVLSYTTITNDGRVNPNRHSYTGPERFRWVCGSIGEKTMGAGLRGKYGISPLENAIHRANSEEEALHECLLVAPHLIRNVKKGDLIRRFRLDKATIEVYLPSLGIPYSRFDEDKFWETTSAAMQMFLVRNHFYNT